MGIYSNEQGFCSYFKIVEHGSNYKLLNINPFLKIFKVLRGRLAASMMDDLQTHRRLLESGRRSYIGLTFSDLDDTMDELEIVQLLVHHHKASLGMHPST